MAIENLSRRSFVKVAGILGAGALFASNFSLALADEKKTDAASDDVEMITVTDMAGREVTFPKNPTRVFSTSPTCEAWLAAICPEAIIGWANDMSADQLSYYPEECRDKETIGGWYGGKEGNAEGIVAEAPQVIVAAYNLETDESYGADVEELETKLGVPVLCVSWVIKDIPEVYRKLGEWFGKEELGKKLGDYVQGVLDKVDETVAKVPEDQVARYYYAENTDGLQTEGTGSFHIAVYDYCKLTNAADIEMTSGMGFEQVSMEQIINWNPENIFVYSTTAFETITTDPTWADIEAVKNGHVFMNPSMPQNWFDRSPNPLRVLGCLYTVSCVYPDYCDFDLETEVKDYFKTLYNVEVTDEMYDALLTTGTDD